MLAAQLISKTLRIGNRIFQIVLRVCVLVHTNGQDPGSAGALQGVGPCQHQTCVFTFDVVLIESVCRHSLIAVANALEALRMANRLIGREVYEWSLLSLDGRTVEASSGLSLAPTVALEKLQKAEIIFVCGGISDVDSNLDRAHQDVLG